MSEDTLGCRALELRGERVPLPSIGKMPEMLPSILQCPGQPPALRMIPPYSAEAERLEGSEAIERSSQNRDSGAFGHTVTHN